MEPQTNCLSLSELKSLIAEKKQELKIIDVRSKTEFDAQHIPGAIHIPVDDIQLCETLFSKTDILITVCGKGGGRSASTSDALQKMGYQSHWLCGGTFGWFE